MNQSEHPTQKAPSPTANNAPLAGPLNWVLRLRGWFRLLLIPYLVLIAVSGFIGILGASYGAVSASAAGAIKFLLTSTGGVVVIAAPVLMLLIPSRSQIVLAAQGLVILGMSGVSLFVLTTAFIAVFEPKLSRTNFEALASSVRTEYAGESPIMLLGRQVGIDVVTEVILPANLELDYHGHAIAAAMRGAGNLVYTMGAASPAHAEMTRLGKLNSMTHKMSAVTLQMPDGRPLDALPYLTVALQSSYFRKEGGPVVLPKGRYRKTVSYWFDGIDTIQAALYGKNLGLRQVPQQYHLPERDAATGAAVTELDWRTLPGQLCKTNNPFVVRNDAAAVGKLRYDETQWTIESSASKSVSVDGPNSRGPEIKFATGAAIKAKFVPAAWARTHAEINLPSCDSVVAAVTEELARSAKKKPQ